jgi:flagellar biosynthesis regulator FlaF
MLNTTQAFQAYRATANRRSQRDREAEVFLQVTAGLRAARDGTEIRQVRALADNRRLWTTVNDLMTDPTNALAPQLRASILSIALTVHQVMDQDKPDFDFLITINDNIAAGLASKR